MDPPAPPHGRSSPIGLRKGLLLGEALIGLAAASVALSLLPFRRVVRDRVPPDKARRRACDLRQLRWAVEAAARRVPWRAVCFQRALALRAMLRRRGIGSTLHYGIAQKTADGLKAHVWLSVDGEIVLGGETASRFACVGSFPGKGEA